MESTLKEKKAAKKAEELSALVWQNTIKEVCNTPAGRRFIWRVLEKCGVNRNPYVGQRNGTDFRCGEMNVGLWLQAEVVNADEKILFNMMTEAKKGAYNV